MECVKPLYIAAHEIHVPCGKCPQCGANKRADWATRLHFEARQHLESKFVTLTYANHKLRWKHGQSQLCKRDLQLWFKRVRRAGYKCRYYAVGEYGSTTYRPHYHVILFGPVPDTVIRDAWCDEFKNGLGSLGHVHIGTVTQASIMYCLGYLVNAKAPLMVHHRERPFALMSRKPGLGSAYMTPEMLAWQRSERKSYVVVDGEKRHLPRFYKERMFSKIDQVRMAVTASKVWLAKEIAWSREPGQLLMSYPKLVAYKRELRNRLSERIRAHSKSSTSI